MRPILMLNFARSGGTLLARILSTEPNIVLVSEVNTLRGVSPKFEMLEPEIAIKQQMSNWFGIHLVGSSFKECVAELQAHCNTTDKQLVIRDWTFLDFFPTEFNNHSPSYRLSIIENLTEIFDFHTFALVRNAIDVYLSMGGDVNKFAENYLRYVESLIANSIFTIKYEYLCENPVSVIEELCDHIGIVFKGDISAYKNVSHVTGDIYQGDASRGIRARSIQIMPRKWVSPRIRRRINASASLKRANELLGYPSLYEDANVESLSAMIKRQLNNIFAKIR